MTMTSDNPPEGLPGWPEPQTHFDERGGTFEAFLASCGIFPEDRHTRQALREHGINHWLIFLHLTLNDHLVWGIQLAQAGHLARGGAKVLRGLQEGLAPNQREGAWALP